MASKLRVGLEPRSWSDQALTLRSRTLANTFARRPRARHQSAPNEKWGPALLPAPTAPSEGSTGVRNLDLLAPRGSPLPVFVPGSPAQASLPAEPLSPEGKALAFYLGAHPEAASCSSARPVRRPSHPAIRGPSWDHPFSAFRSARPCFRRSAFEASRRARRKIVSSGASSRLASVRHPKVSFQSPAGGDRGFGACRVPPAVAGAWRRLGPPSRSPIPYEPAPESLKAVSR